MKTDVTEALRQLRAADPASDVPDEQWAGSGAQALTKQHAPGQLPLDAPAPATRWTRRWPAALAAAAVVAGVSVAAVELSNGHGTSRQPVAEPTGSGSQSRPAPPVSTNGSGSPTSSTPPAPTGPDPHKLEAEHFVQNLLKRAPLPPGAHRRATAHNAALRNAVGKSRNGVLVHRVGAFFTAPGTMDQAIAYLRTRVPRGMRFDGIGMGAHYDVVTSRDVSYAIDATGDLRDVSLTIFVAPYRGGIGVAMEADAEWVPSRPPGYLIEGATSVAVTVRRGVKKPSDPHLPYAPTVRRTLTGPVVGRLARVVNELAPEIGGGSACTWQYAKFDDTVVFATPTGSVRAFATTTGCTKLSLDFADGRHLDLDPGGLDAAVLHALGLSRHYPRR